MHRRHVDIDRIWEGTWENDVEIIGVYDDYEFRPNFNDQKAQAASILTYKHFLIPNFKPSKISIKLNLETLNSSLSDLEKLYKSVFPKKRSGGLFWIREY